MVAEYEQAVVIITENNRKTFETTENLGLRFLTPNPNPKP